MGRVTIKDVAKRSNSSVTTVSRVLSNSSYPISPALRQRILDAAKELNYTPNLMARGLKKQVGSEIAVIVPSIMNPFYTAIIKGIETVAAPQGYGLLVYITGADGRSTQDVVDSIRGKMIAGVVAAADSADDTMLEAFAAMSRETDTSTILVDYDKSNANSIAGIFFDYHKGAVMAANYLIEKGHREIAFATNHLDRPSREFRYDGFCRALAKAGVPLNEDFVFIHEGETRFEAGVLLAQQIAACPHRPTAVACINDTVAAGLLNGFATLGISVPGDISVIGFDDSVFAQMTYPALTTIRVDAEKMGQLAATSLVKLINKEDSGYSIYLEPAVVERSTVKAL